MARYGQAMKDRVVASLLPPESVAIGTVSQEVGILVRTLERWRGEALTGCVFAVRVERLAGGHPSLGVGQIQSGMSCRTLATNFFGKNDCATSLACFPDDITPLKSSALYSRNAFY